MKAAGASRHGREDVRLEAGLVHGAAQPYTLQSGEADTLMQLTCDNISVTFQEDAGSRGSSSRSQSSFSHRTAPAVIRSLLTSFSS